MVHWESVQTYQALLELPLLSPPFALARLAEPGPPKPDHRQSHLDFPKVDQGFDVDQEVGNSTSFFANLL